MQEQGTNNLIILDKNFNQKFKYDSQIQDRAPFNQFRQPQFSFEGSKVIWFGGKTTLFSVDLRDMSILKIENVMPKDLQGAVPPEPLHVIADFEREKILASFYFEDEYVLSYNEKGREADIHILTDIFPKFNHLTCMDTDRKKLFGFIGGSTMREAGTSLMSRNSYTKNAVVSAFTFNKNLKIVANLVLPQEKCSTVGSIVVSPIHEDIIYVTTDGPLFVLGLDVTERKFHIIKAVNYHNKGK